jgi:hypothetical protein
MSERRYRLFGLDVRSDFVLPELSLSSSQCDDLVIIRECLSPPAGSPDRPSSWIDGSGVRLYWPTVGSFAIRDGREVIVDPLPDADPDWVRLFLLGAAMGVALHQRGLAVLHASAVSVEGSAVAFVAFKSWGKSTTAAAMEARGHRLLTDDVLALQLAGRGRSPLAWPSFPQMKLSPDAVEALGEDPNALGQILPGYEKLRRLPLGAFTGDAVPLRCLYVLEPGDEPSINPLSKVNAVLELLCHSYIRRFGPDVAGPEESATFQRCAEIADQVPVFSFRRPRQVERIDAFARQLEDHMRSVVARPEAQAGKHP